MKKESVWLVMIFAAIGMVGLGGCCKCEKNVLPASETPLAQTVAPSYASQGMQAVPASPVRENVAAGRARSAIK